MSTFSDDLAKESILSEFLDKKYAEIGLVTERVTDKELQKLGVDFLLKKDGIEKRVDEKAQLSYINRSLPTFALEIDYFIGEDKKLGWLFDADKYTDIYAFVFGVMVNNKEGTLQKVADIVSCEVVLVRRISLLNELSAAGFTLLSCKEKSDELRAGTDTKLLVSADFNFHISRHLSEKPVNLIVRKAFLEDIGKKFILKA